MRIVPFVLLFTLLLTLLGGMSPAARGQRSPRTPAGRSTSALARPADSPEKRRIESIRSAALKKDATEAEIKAYMDVLPRDGSRYIVEGDLLMTEEELRVYLEGQTTETRPVTPGPELIINLHDGQDDFYKDPAKRTLTYAVDRSSFPNGRAGWYRTVVQNVQAAAQEWEGACPGCQIRFLYMKEQDGSPTTDEVNFVVRYRDVKGEYIAASFFPSDGPLKRYLNVDPSYFTTEYDKVGVMRHELGHVLGYRHEHTRSVPGCYYEDNQWRPLSPYDAKSVMHYFCGGGGGLSLALSRTDKESHRRQYGLPR